MSKLKPIKFENDTLILLDQRKIPTEEIYVENRTIDDVFISIREMVVRGAPCIGFSGIFGIALWVKHNPLDITKLREACDYLISSRPTAINLAYEIERVYNLIKNETTEDIAYKKVIQFGFEQIELSEKNHRNMAMILQKDLENRLGKRPYRILTHCNTGYLACGSLGTALGAIDHLADQKLIENVWVDETRPYWQGVRLTAFELNKLNIPHKIVVEGAASYLMSNKLVDAIFVGADRIVSNGDTANKVGTSNLAVLANYYGVPFYVLAPSSSFDLSMKSGAEIEIELRDQNEVLEFRGVRVAPVGSEAFNPSFDVTEGKLITGIVSEKGIATSNYTETLSGIVK